MSDARPVRTRAEVRHSRFPGWIWAVPIAALAVTVWLGVRTLAQGGEHVTVAFDAAHGAKAGDTKVSLKGIEVGQVSKVSLTPDAKGVVFDLKLDHDVAKYLRAGTKFWLEGANVSLSDPSSIKSIVAGPTVILDPGPGARVSRFVGLEEPPNDALVGPLATYLVRFDGAVGGLKPGAPVMLRGFRVGQVSDVALRYDATTGTLETPVRIALEPKRLHIVGVAPPAGGDWRPITDDMLRHLIARGLRATLVQSPPLIGSEQVDLAFVGTGKPAELEVHDGVVEIPSAASAGIAALTSDASHLMGRADDVIGKIDAIPFEQIGGNVRAATARISALTSSPRITDALDRLDDSTVQIDRAVRAAGPQIGPLVAKLRQTADGADATVADANRLIAGNPESQDSDLPSALHELTDAARSIRALASYLEQHPESLIRGKGKERGR